MAANPDGPLNLVLHRYLDQPAKIMVRRWKRDHPITIALTLDEFELLARTRDEVRRQLEIEPQAGSSAGSDLDLIILVGEGAPGQ